MVGQVLGAVYTFFKNLLNAALKFLGDLLGHLFNGLIAVLKAIFKPILILIALVAYFIFKLGELVVTLLSVLLAIGKLIYSFIMGLFKTLAGLSWTPTTPSHGSWSAPIGEVFDALSLFQLDKIAYLMTFVIWVLTAIGAIRILTTRGGDGE